MQLRHIFTRSANVGGSPGRILSCRNTMESKWLACQSGMCAFVHVYMCQGPAGLGCIGPRYTCFETQDVLRRAAKPCGHKQVHQVAKFSQGCPCIWDRKVATARIVRRSVRVSGPLVVLHVQHARTQQPSLPLQTHTYLSGLRQEADVV